MLKAGKLLFADSCRRSSGAIAAMRRFALAKRPRVGASLNRLRATGGARSGDSGDVSGLRRGACSTSSSKARRGRRRRTIAARAGGSPFNVAIGLARLGQASGLLTGLSSDLLGQRLGQVLAAEGVSTAYAIPTDRPTTLSLVGLDTAGVPAYQFYDNGSADTGVGRGGPAGARGRGRRACTSAPTRWRRRRSADAMAALARGNARALHLGRSERAADGRARHGRLARAAGGALPAGRPRQDQRRGPGAAAPGHRGRGARGRPDRRRASASSW